MIELDWIVVELFTTEVDVIKVDVWSLELIGDVVVTTDDVNGMRVEDDDDSCVVVSLNVVVNGESDELMIVEL